MFCLFAGEELMAMTTEERFESIEKRLDGFEERLSRIEELLRDRQKAQDEDEKEQIQNRQQAADHEKDDTAPATEKNGLAKNQGQERQDEAGKTSPEPTQKQPQPDNGFFDAEEKRLDEIAKEFNANLQKMRDDLAKRRAAAEQAPEEEKKGLLARFSDWMHNIYQNNVNELRKILGMRPLEEKKEPENRTAAETVVNQQSPDKDAEIERLKKLVDDLKAKLKQQDKEPEKSSEKTPDPHEQKPEAKNKEPANNIVTGGRLTPLADISNVPDKYKDVVNSKELLTPNDFMAAFVYTALKNRDLNQKFKGMFDNLRKEDSESHVAPGSDIDYIGAFAWRALLYSIKTKSTAVACKSPRNVQCLAYPKESFDFHLNVKKLKSELCLFTGEGGNPDNEKDFDPEKYGAPQAEEMAKYITQVLENMDKSLQKGMNLQPAEMREVVKANSVEAINHFVQQGMSRKQAIDDVYNRYLKTWKYSASAVISNCIYRASEGGLKLWHERVANVPEKAAAIDAGFIDRNGERNSLASIRKNRFTGVLKEVPQSVQEKITEDRKAQGLIR